MVQLWREYIYIYIYNKKRKGKTYLNNVEVREETALDAGDVGSDDKDEVHKSSGVDHDLVLSLGHLVIVVDRRHGGEGNDGEELIMVWGKR